jgi:acyl-CoA thioesterase
VNAATAEELATRCAAAMLERDHASRQLGMRLEAAEPGAATVSMTLTAAMCNGHGTAHGGVIFTLADSAFAFACNSRDVASVAQHCTITFVSPGRSGERLVASAREVSLAGRFGIYDVVVRGADERTVAIFQGNSAAIRGTVLERS